MAQIISQSGPLSSTGVLWHANTDQYDGLTLNIVENSGNTIVVETSTNNTDWVVVGTTSGKGRSFYPADTAYMRVQVSVYVSGTIVVDVEPTTVSPASVNASNAEDIYAARVEELGIDKSGLTDAGPLLRRLFEKAITAGQVARVDKGTYLIASPVIVTLFASLEVRCHPEARFVAAARLNNKMIVLSNSNNSLRPSVKWSGGKFDGSAVGNSPAGQAWDCLTISEKVADVEISSVKFYTGEDYTVAGGDSHIFVVGERIKINGCVFEGACDAGIYASGTNTFDFGENLEVSNNTFIKCATGAIAKRRFKRTSYLNNEATSCGAGFGVGDVGGAATNSTGDKVFAVGNRAIKCQQAFFVRACAGSLVAMNYIEDFGTHPITGVKASISSAISIEGATCTMVTSNTIRMVSWANNSSTRAVSVLSRTLQDTGSTVLHSTGNTIVHNVVENVQVGFYESSVNQTGNYYFNPSLVSVPTHYSLLGSTAAGTFSANADAAVTGYVTWKDASGVSRKLAVIA